MSDFSNLDHLQVLDPRARMACPKGLSRLQEVKAEQKLTVVDERTFKTEVWTRDAGCCRMCGRKVRKGVGRVPTRGEVHHLHGRRGDLRFESKATILVCLECHEKLTGRVNERWIAVGSAFWTLKGAMLIDARAPITFQRAV